MYENEGNFHDLVFSENAKRLKKQKDSPISVVIGNPPYSAGQTTENANNKNPKYPNVDD
jgi:predicted helicase